MFQIKKIRANHVIDFAAEELKKYLRMMMPEAGDIDISYEPDAKDGFRLGLLEDFNLPNEAEDVVLDDVVHIDTDTCGGVLAGSNPRSVLFAVYRFLRLNGCRWLYPGIDGEYIPMKDIEPVTYHKMADHRMRGHCNEGAESQQCMMETIDFYAKQELNIYMIEFKIPNGYYDSYYNHRLNDKNRPPEPVSLQQVLQWKRMCETEIAKRGLQFHDMGHGWTVEPFGITSAGDWTTDRQKFPEENKRFLAQVGGVRDFYRGVPINTQVCMSNPEVRQIMVDSIVEYAQMHGNVDYLHVWLADGSRNHCECEECIKATPSDFYMDLMNELDVALEAKGLDSRIVFIVYCDTLWAPEKTVIKNPKRFSLLYAPIHRSYTASADENTVVPPQKPYVRNKYKSPLSIEDNLSFVKEWQKNWNGPCFSYEYHFWKHQYYDLGFMELSRRIYEDIRGLRFCKLDGYVEDGSQRSFFPHGFPMYVYAEALLNRDVDYEQLQEDYFKHIYGDQWEKVRSYLSRMTAAFDFAYLEGEKSSNPEIGKYYNPGQVKKLAMVKEIAAEGRMIANEHLAMPTRPQTVSMRLLLRHSEYCERMAEVLMEKCVGNNVLAKELHDKLAHDFGKYEFEIERYFDHYLAFSSYKWILTLAGAVTLIPGAVD